MLITEILKKKKKEGNINKVKVSDTEVLFKNHLFI